MTLACSPAIKMSPESRSSDEGATAIWFNGLEGSTFVKTLPVLASQALRTRASDDSINEEAVSREDECHFRSTIGNIF